MDFVTQLETDFRQQADRNIAVNQEAYLQNQFELYGLPTPLRKEIQKPFLLKENLPNKKELPHIITELWSKPQREFQYFAIDLNRKYLKKIEFQDIELFELMITNKSWWDTVDLIATNLVGAYFKLFPEQIIPVTKKWMNSDNMWLQRTCLIFQLKYKEEIDTDLLTDYILQLKDTKEFFINKAIGWILREYTRKNPEWVIDFVNKYELSNLSKREALKLIN
ncbi:MAG: DNA alkylation repair protein [Flavobacteriales bacterium]|jgi:3-methyladenine DNA glycosylase AlkD|tara:strand:- start:18829 stop:19494 length:666 start_codon:yes stop_codon:yes gene_type:complete